MSKDSLPEYIGIYYDRCISGEEFNKKFPDLADKLVKLTNKEENHNGYLFKDGLNEDNKEFNPDPYSPGGFCFTEVDQIHYWLKYGSNIMKYCRKVTILPDSKIYIGNRVFKVDKIFLAEREKILDLKFWPDEESQLRAIKRNECNIRCFRNPSEKVQLAAVKKNSYLLGYLKNPSEKVQLAAVKRDGDCLEFIKNPSKIIQLAGVKQNGESIEHIDNPDEDIKIAAVKYSRSIIGYIKDPSERVQLAAIKKNWSAIEYIKNPTKRTQLAVVEQNADALYYIYQKDIHVSKKVQLAAVKQKGSTIRYIPNPSKKVRLAAGPAHTCLL